MKRIRLSLAVVGLFAIAAAASAQTVLPTIGKTMVIDLKGRDISGCAYLQVAHMPRVFGCKDLDGYGWMLGGFNFSKSSADGGVAGVLAYKYFYFGAAELMTSQKPSSFGLVAGFTAHF